MSQVVHASLDHKFLVSKFGSFWEDERYYGDVAYVTHDNVSIGLRLFLTPVESRPQFQSKLEFYLEYVTGPQQNISIGWQLFVVNAKKKKISIVKHKSSFIRGWGTAFIGSLGNCTVSSKATDLAAKGYLTQENTILHLMADVKIPFDAFVVPDGLGPAAPSDSRKYQLSQLVCSTMGKVIRASLDHKFDVAKLGSFGENQHYDGDMAYVTHDNVNFGFRIFLRPVDTRPQFQDNLGFFLQYVKGPQQNISIEYEFFVVNAEEKKISIFKGRSSTFIRGKWWGSGRVLSRNANDLAAKGYLILENTILHLMVDVSIPWDAFVVPDGLCPAAPSKSEYICQDLNRSLAPKTSPTRQEEEQLAIAIQESEEEEKERQRQLDLFRQYNGPDVGLDQGLSHTEAKENFTDGPDKGGSTNISFRDHELYPSLSMTENEAKQDVVVGSDAVSPPASTQQTLESHLNSSTQSNQHFALGLREQIDVFTNRLLSNQTHGRSIVNDSMIETLFVSLTSQHGALLERMQTLGDKRVHYCWLQERMAEIGELRRALDELRNEEKRKKQIHKQIIIQHKLTQLRTHKHQMLEQRRIMLALQRFQYGQGQMIATQQDSILPQQPSAPFEAFEPAASQNLNWMSNYGVVPWYGLSMQQWRNNYNPNQTLIQQPIQQQYSHSQHAYPSPQYLNATAPPQMCPQMPGADQQGNNTNQPNMGLLIDL